MNTSLRMAVCVAASALAWRCAAGPAITPIDLPTAIRLALDQPAARAAAHEVAASQALVAQADRLPNPELSYLREGQQAGTRTTTVQINQPVELGRKRQARVAVAQQAAGLAQVEWEARRQDIRADVVMAWHEVHIAARRREVAQALTDLARRTVDVAGKRVAAGKISPIDETRARLAAVDAVTALTQAEAALTLARTRLGALVGQPADTLVLVADGAPLPDVEPLAALLARAGESSADRQSSTSPAAVQARGCGRSDTSTPAAGAIRSSSRTRGAAGGASFFRARACGRCQSRRAASSPGARRRCRSVDWLLEDRSRITS